MTATNNQCLECGAFSTVSFEDEWLECLSCRNITYIGEPPEFHGQQCECHLECSTNALQAAWAEPIESKSIHGFVTVHGVRPHVEVIKECYARGGFGLQLWDDDGPLLTASRWLPGIPTGCVAIKDFDENAGCLEQLIAQGIIEPPQEFLEGLPVCRLRI